jgi:phage terminase large subunit-like protein
VITLDPAYSDDSKADWKVACVVAIDQNQNRYLLEYIRTHKPTGEYIDSSLNLYLKYKDVLTGFGVPCQGTEKEFFKSVVEKATNRRLFPPFCELKNIYTTAEGKAKTNKQARIIAALQPLFEQGKYYIQSSQVEAKEEILTIGSSVHDDLVDAMCYAEQILQPVYYDMKQSNIDIEEREEVLRGDTGYGL